MDNYTLGLALNEIELPERYPIDYNFKVTQFLTSLSDDLGVELKDYTIYKNQVFGEIVIKNFMLEGDLDFVLNLAGYNLFETYSFIDFENSLSSNIPLSKAIIDGKVLVGSTKNFEEIILATKTYSLNEVVYDIIN